MRERLRRIAGMSRSLSSSGSILCFHSIVGPATPSRGSTHVPLESLVSAVAAARRVGEVVPLPHLVERHQAGRSTAGLTAITFDDAYAALLQGTADLLRREAIPATIFVATDFAATGGAFWWDRLEDAHALAPRDRWRQFERDCGLPEAYRMGQPAEYGPFRPFRQWVLAEYRGRWPAALEPILHGLEQETGCTAHRSMTFDELADLRHHAGVDIGVHTQSHPVLPLLPHAEQVAEIASAHEILRQRFGDVVPVLAVPFGLFDSATAGAASEAGMTAALTLAGTTLDGGNAAELLPRFCITLGEPVWKLQLRLTGAVDRLRRLRGHSLAEFPPLPSATT